MAESTISSGTVIVGRVIAKSDLVIDGRVEGSIEATGDVTLSSTSLIKSDVKAMRLHVAGAVAGNLHGEELLVLEEGARVVGNVAAPAIGIRPGALIRGRVETSSAPPKATAPARRTAATKAAPARKAPAPVMPKAAKKATKKTAKKAAKKTTARRSTASKAAAKKTTKRTTAKKAATKKSAPSKRRRAPAPVVPALKKRTKKASKRRAR